MTVVRIVWTTLALAAVANACKSSTGTVDADQPHDSGFDALLDAPTDSNEIDARPDAATDVDVGVTDAEVDTPTDAGPRPNVVVIIADDMRFDTTGEAQTRLAASDRAFFPWLIGQTPNLDTLASEGTTFTNTFVVSSLCAPSRAAMLTGQYGHINGVVENGDVLDSSAATYAKVFQTAGYHTGYFGKWHLSREIERPGFDEYASFAGLGSYTGQAFDVSGVAEPVVPDEWLDDATTDFALSFITSHAADADPFLAVVGFKSPHGPYDPPERLATLFNGVSSDEVHSRPNATAYPAWMQTDRFEAECDAPPGDLTCPAQWNITGFRNYFECIVGIDENVGRIMTELDTLGLADNTIVVFVSDNGYLLTDHGLLSKQFAYEESIRVPMIVRFPGRIAADELYEGTVLNIDLAPSLLDLAGLTAPDSFQGTSWVGAVTGRREFRSGFLYEFNHLEQPELGIPLVGYRSSNAILVTYAERSDLTELFELADDPFQLNNQVSSDTALLSNMQTLLNLAKIDVNYVVLDRP